LTTTPTGPFGGKKSRGIWRFEGNSIIEECTTAHYVTTQRTPKRHPLERLEQEDDIMKSRIYRAREYGSGNVSQIDQSGPRFGRLQPHAKASPRKCGASERSRRYASEAAAGVEVLITMLADDRAVQDVIFEPGAAIESLPEGAGPYLDEYISVDLSRGLAKSHANKHQNYIAAPVFGRPDAAAAGKLFIVSAGPSESIEKLPQACSPRWGQRTFMIK